MVRPGLGRLVALTAALAACARVVPSPPAAGEARCLGVPWSPADTLEEVAPGTFAARVPRRGPAGLDLPATLGCAALHDPAVLRWVPPSDGVVQVVDAASRPLLVRAYDNCAAPPRLCARSLGPTSERGVRVTAGRPIFLVVAWLGGVPRPPEPPRDLEYLFVLAHLGPRAPLYAPCALVPTPTRAACDEGAACDQTCVPPREVGAWCASRADCADGLWCVDGRCAHPLAVPGARPCADEGAPCDGGRCVEGRCRAVAAAGEPCADDRACVEGTLCGPPLCLPVAPIGAACASGVACAPESGCAGTRDGPRCLPLRPAACDPSRPCSPGARCVAGSCVRTGDCDFAEVTTPPRCDDDRWCVAGGDSPWPLCRAAGETGSVCRREGSACDGTDVCVEGFCQPVVALGGRCAPRGPICARGAHCGPAAVCALDGPAGGAGGPCRPGLGCDAGARCDPSSLLCVATVGSGGRCARAAECPAGEVCDDALGRCRRPAAADEACDGSRACADGLDCRAGRCQPLLPSARPPREDDPCGDDAACAGIGRCASGRCRAARPPGARCATGDDCRATDRCRATADGARCLP